jgi:hypothetical protein
MHSQNDVTGNAATNDPSNASDAVTRFTEIFFTGPVVAIVAIVACGRWLGMLFVLPRQQRGKFGISMPGINFTATDQEVLLGLTAFVVTVGVLGVTVRGKIGPFVKSDFGIDVGQFVSLCFVSSLIILAIAVAAFAVKLISSARVFHKDNLVAEQQKRIESLAGKDI